MALMLGIASLLGCDGRPYHWGDAGPVDAAGNPQDPGRIGGGGASNAGGQAQGASSSGPGGNASGAIDDALASDDASAPTDGSLPDAQPSLLDGGRGAPIVIFLIADGYGAAQIDATRMFLNGDTEPLSFERLPHRAWVTTNNASGDVTDSGAAATALATGHKVEQYVLSVAIPGDGRRLPTALEMQAARGKRTGLVTTHTPITDATPAAFGAHVSNRFDEPEVAHQLLNDSRPNVLFGLGSINITPATAAAAGYTVVQSADEIAALDPDTEEYVSGQFTEFTIPSLKDLALTAIDLLDSSEEGFFLLVETEESDTGGHANDLQKVVNAGVEFNTMAQAVLAWAAGRTDVLIIVGADHETGGLVLMEDNPTAGVLPNHMYTSGGVHTGAQVRYFADGRGAESVSGELDNTDFFPLLAGL
jgi:alkaline phosphatase